ncbi:MAG: TPM domain-containing protein, partial [Burkholderiales bacterium]
MRAIRFAALFFCLAIMCTFAAAADSALQPVPPLSARVTDVTSTLTADQKASLEQSLSAFEAKKGAQIAVLIVGSTAPEAIEQYSLRVVEQWKLGRKKVDDGALLIVAKDDRAMRIEVGYGLEGALNDAVCKRIISEVITPPFRQGDFYGGISAGIDSMMSVVNGEPLPAPTGRAGGGRADWGHLLPVIFIAVLALGGVLRSVLGRFPGALVTGGVTAFLAWAIMGALSISIIAGVLA